MTGSQQLQRTLPISHVNTGNHRVIYSVTSGSDLDACGNAQANNDDNIDLDKKTQEFLVLPKKHEINKSAKTAPATRETSTKALPRAQAVKATSVPCADRTSIYGKDTQGRKQSKTGKSGKKFRHKHKAFFVLPSKLVNGLKANDFVGAIHCHTCWLNNNPISIALKNNLQWTPYYHPKQPMCLRCP